jgi:ABC-type transporter Mla MlaB component
MAAPVPKTVAFAIRGPITRADVGRLCNRVRTLLREHAADAVVCDVTGVECDAVTVDALARLQLAARRQGCEIRLSGACPELVELVTFMGLRDVLIDH